MLRIIAQLFALVKSFFIAALYKGAYPLHLQHSGLNKHAVIPYLYVRPCGRGGL